MGTTVHRKWTANFETKIIKIKNPQGIVEIQLCMRKLYKQ